MSRASSGPRVVVSGLGVVSPYGAGTKTFWAGLASGACAIKPITLIETEGFRSRIAAEIPGDTVAALPASRRRSRADRLALAAATEALADAGLHADERAAAALAVGAVGGGMFEGEEWYWEETRSGKPSPKIRALRSILPYSHAETLGWRQRGARVYAELAGAGMTTDAYHVTAPHPDGEGMMDAMRLALSAARLTPDGIGYVNAHGTGTPQNDRIEALALSRVFGDGAALVSSTKSLIGHTMAAAGSVEAVATVLALVHDLVPPTANLRNVDPEVPFDCVPLTARPAELGAAMSNSFGFGGQNVSLIFRQPER